MASMPERLLSLPPAALDGPAAVHTQQRNRPPTGGTSLLRRPGAAESSSSQPTERQPSSAASSSQSRGRPVLKSQQLMTSASRRRENSEEGVFAMDIDDDDSCMVHATPSPFGPAPTGRSSSCSPQDTTAASAPHQLNVVDVSDGGMQAATSAPAASTLLHPPIAQRGASSTGSFKSATPRGSSSSTGPSGSGALMPPPMSLGAPAVKASGKAASMPSPRLSSLSTSLPMAAPPPGGGLGGGLLHAPEPSRKQSSGSQRRASETLAPPAAEVKKPRRHGSASSMSAPNTPNLGPNLGPHVPIGSTLSLNPTPRGTPKLGPQPMVLAASSSPALGPVKLSSKSNSKNNSTKDSAKASPKGSAKASPMLGPAPSPRFGPSGALVPLDADIQPHAHVRTHEFRSGRRVFHVHFGHGFVRSIDEPESADGGAAAAMTIPPPTVERSLSQTQNINVHFDNPKFPKPQRLRAFYAVPKMVVIPSSTALRKQKLHTAIGATPPTEAGRVSLVRSLLATGAPRAACKLVLRWQLQKHFPPAELVGRLLDTKCHASAMRFARDFRVGRAHPSNALLARMIADGHYEGALKHTNKTAASVDGTHSPADVLRMMISNGQHAIALKYVHKFKLSEAFAPDALVRTVLASTAELCVRTCGLLLKYVTAFNLQAAFPMASLLEKVACCGVTVHEIDGKYLLKGRRRQVAQPGQSLSHGASPQPGASPIITGIGAVLP